MTFELIKQATGTDIVMVPYAGGAPALQAVLGGQVQAMIVPTLAETVAPQIDTCVWQALFAPAGTPPAVIQQIGPDTAAALALPDVREKLAGMGMEIVPGTPEALARFLREDIETWRRVSRAAAIQPE